MFLSFRTIVFNGLMMKSTVQKQLTDCLNLVQLQQHVKDVSNCIASRIAAQNSVAAARFNLTEKN